MKVNYLENEARKDMQIQGIPPRLLSMLRFLAPFDIRGCQNIFILCKRHKSIFLHSKKSVHCVCLDVRVFRMSTRYKHILIS